jgi:hypothetical protein
LGDLVASLGGLSPEYQHQVWDLIVRWARSGAATDGAKASLRERLRRHSFTRRATRNARLASADRARETFDLLAPADPAFRHLWLFLTPWVEESADEIEDDGLDYIKRQQRIHALRHDAIAELWPARGFCGISILLAKGDAAFIVGFTLAGLEADQADRVRVIEACLSSATLPRTKADAFMQGYLGRLGDVDREQLLSHLLTVVSQQHHSTATKAPRPGADTAERFRERDLHRGDLRHGAGLRPATPAPFARDSLARLEPSVQGNRRPSVVPHPGLPMGASVEGT